MPRKVVFPSTTNQTTSARIVLADPDQTLHEAYRAKFAKERVEIVPAFSGIDCIRRLREHPTDALVIEPDLPWGGGEGVLAVMGGIPQWAVIPVMVLTAVRDIRLLNGLAHFPIHDFQVKPRTAAELAARVRLLLDPARRHDALTGRNARLERVIVQRTGDRIRKLRVAASAEEIVIHGVAHSPDVGQAAIAAVSDSLRRTEAVPIRVELNLEYADRFNQQHPEHREILE